MHDHKTRLLHQDILSRRQFGQAPQSDQPKAEKPAAKPRAKNAAAKITKKDDPKIK